MDAHPPDRTAILIVRLWTGANDQGVLARITQTLDSTGTERTIGATANPEDICGTVRTWIERFIASE